MGFGDRGDRDGCKNKELKGITKSLLRLEGVGMEQEDGAQANRNQPRMLPECCHHVAGRRRAEMLWETVGRGAAGGGRSRHRQTWRPRVLQYGLACDWRGSEASSIHELPYLSIRRGDSHVHSVPPSICTTLGHGSFLSPQDSVDKGVFN